MHKLVQIKLCDISNLSEESVYLKIKLKINEVPFSRSTKLNFHSIISALVCEFYLL